MASLTASMRRPTLACQQGPSVVWGRGKCSSTYTEMEVHKTTRRISIAPMQRIPESGFPKIRGNFGGGPYKKLYSIVGSQLGCPHSKETAKCRFDNQL